MIKKLYSSDTMGKQGKFWSVEKKKEKRKKKKVTPRDLLRDLKMTLFKWIDFPQDYHGEPASIEIG